MMASQQYIQHSVNFFFFFFCSTVFPSISYINREQDTLYLEEKGNNRGQILITTRVCWVFMNQGHFYNYNFLL